MEIDVKRLKRLIVEKNTTLEALACFLGMNRTTLYRKLREGATALTVNDAAKIAAFLGISYEESLGIFWRRVYHNQG